MNKLINFIDDNPIPFLLFVICMFVFFMGFVFPATMSHISAIGHIAAIEQLREDSTKVDFLSNEDVMGQITKYNQEIAKAKRYNKIPFLCLYIPNKWDDVETINVVLYGEKR